MEITRPIFDRHVFGRTIDGRIIFQGFDFIVLPSIILPDSCRLSPTALNFLSKAIASASSPKNDWRKPIGRVNSRADNFTDAQNMKITDILRAEHTVFHHLFDHIESVAPKLKTLAEVKSLAALAEKVMAPHSRTEDELFIKPLEHCFEQIGQLETFHDEHEVIEKTFVAVGKAKQLKAAKELLLRAITASRKHFDKEERIVFPLAERVLKAKTLTELGTEWTKRRDAALS